MATWGVSATWCYIIVILMFYSVHLCLWSHSQNGWVTFINSWQRNSDGEGSRTIMFEFWAISAQSTSQLFPEMLEKTLPDLFHLALPDAQQIGPCTTLQRINPASPNSQRPHVSAAEAVMNMCLGISKQQHDRQHSWLNLDNRQTK